MPLRIMIITEPKATICGDEVCPTLFSEHYLIELQRTKTISYIADLPQYANPLSQVLAFDSLDSWSHVMELCARMRVRMAIDDIAHS